MSLSASDYAAMLDTLASHYDHIYLSPHLDDAALSCGGMLARQRAASDSVLVITVCSGVPPVDATFSSFAHHLHMRWNLPPHQAVQARIREDQVALDALGVDACWLGCLDAIYRQPDCYVDDPTLFGQVAPADPLARVLPQMLAGLVQRFPYARIYAPLAVGLHVDHQIVYTAACDLASQGRSVIFYEDFPYVCTPDATEQRLHALGGADRFASKAIVIDSTIEHKIRAIAAYTSQLDMLFGGAEPMARVVRAYAQMIAPRDAWYAERLWYAQAGPVAEMYAPDDI